MLKKGKAIDDKMLDQVTGGGKFLSFSKEGRIYRSAKDIAEAEAAAEAAANTITHMYCHNCGNYADWAGDYKDKTVTCPACHQVQFVGFSSYTK